MKIIGAGLAGLIAAYRFPDARVIEAGDGGENHKALLRFRTDAISKLTGIPFKKVRVHKEICVNDQFVEPNIRLANQYSEKALGFISGDRSIWNVEPVDRYVAPTNFYERLVDGLGNRVTFNKKHDFSSTERGEEYVISTAPLPLVASECGLDTRGLDFGYQRIHTYRFTIAGARDVYQTIYFPSPKNPIYRASITDSLLIVETTRELTESEHMVAIEVLGNVFFGNKSQARLEPLESKAQRFGKIAEVNGQHRKALIHELTDSHGIFSLGRFATWRNILLDDLIQDMDLIEQLLNTETYRRKLLRK